MLSVSSPRSSSSQSSQWVAPPAASWTSEEINMIQEMFLSDEKAIQIRDISISGGKLSVAEDPLAVSVEQCAATSMLLSPIGADDDFLQQFMVDEKDAMAAFFVEAIDPFKNVPDSNASHEPTANSAATGPSDGRPVEHVLAKLRAKVDGLSRLYYSRCMDVSSADDSSINKVKLVLAIERLQRVIQGLSNENAQLKTDTTSCSQRSELLLQGSSDDTSELSHSIDESVCAAAVEEGMHLALNCSMDGEVLKDHQDEHGWGYKSVVSQDGVFTYSLKKSYPKDVNMRDVMQNTWANVTSSDSFSCIYYGSVKAQLVKEVGKETVIMYDMTNHDATRVDRVLAVLFRKKLPNGYLLGARSINMRPTGASDQTNVRWMDCTTWQRYECNADGGFSVTSGGQLSYPSRADIDFMAVEILCLHLRWENRVVGAQLTM